jgi:hypothetical protein
VATLGDGALVAPKPRQLVAAADLRPSCESRRGGDLDALLLVPGRAPRSL